MRFPTLLPLVPLVLAPVALAITAGEFAKSTTLPVDFASAKLRAIANSTAVSLVEKSVLKAINEKNGMLLRELVACPKCKRCMHSVNLYMAGCGHFMHRSCFFSDWKCECGFTLEQGPRRERETGFRRQAETVFHSVLAIFEKEGWIPLSSWTEHLRQHFRLTESVIMEAATALKDCKEVGFFDYIIKKRKQDRAVGVAVCVLTDSELATLTREVVKMDDDELSKYWKLCELFYDCAAPLKDKNMHRTYTHRRVRSHSELLEHISEIHELALANFPSDCHIPPLTNILATATDSVDITDLVALWLYSLAYAMREFLDATLMKVKSRSAMNWSVAIRLVNVVVRRLLDNIIVLKSHNMEKYKHHYERLQYFLNLGDAYDKIAPYKYSWEELENF